jgi:hypothetical protein
MAMHSRAWWQNYRDSHNDSPGKGASKRYSIGKALAAYKTIEDANDFARTLKAAKSLQKTLEGYRKAIEGDHPTFARDFQTDVEGQLAGEIKSLIALVKPGKACQKNLLAAQSLIGKLNAGSSLKDYKEVWESDPIRLVSMNLGRLIKLRPELKNTDIDRAKTKWMNEMDKVNPADMDDDPKEIGKAVTAMRKAVKELDDTGSESGLW